MKALWIDNGHLLCTDLLYSEWTKTDVQDSLYKY